VDELIAAAQRQLVHSNRLAGAGGAIGVDERQVRVTLPTAGVLDETGRSIGVDPVAVQILSRRDIPRISRAERYDARHLHVVGKLEDRGPGERVPAIVLVEPA